MPAEIVQLAVQQEVKPAHGNEKNALVLWGDAPRWEYSTAPLMGADGQPVERPNPGSGGHAMYFNDQQVQFHIVATSGKSDCAY